MVTRMRNIPFKFNAIKFGNEIMIAKIHTGLSNADIAELCGIVPSAISRYERAEEPNMKMQSFLAVCNALDLNPINYFDLDD